MVAPGALRWLAYAFGARLPVRFRAWVRHDLTADGWERRHLARTLVQVSPSLLLLLLPGPWLLRLSLPLLVLIGALYVSVSYLQESRVARLHRNGVPVEAATEADEARRDAKELAELVRIERRREKFRARYSEGGGSGHEHPGHPRPRPRQPGS